MVGWLLFIVESWLMGRFKGRDYAESAPLFAVPFSTIVRARHGNV